MPGLGAATFLLPTKTLHLPAALRAELAAPFGHVFSTTDLPTVLAGPQPILAIGDVVALTLKRLGLVPKLFACDYQSQRSRADEATFRAELGTWGTWERAITNPPAALRPEAWAAVRDALVEPGAPHRIVVHGEEDLLGLPAILLAPLGSRLVYGQPNRGAVVATVSPDLRDRARSMLARFTPG